MVYFQNVNIATGNNHLNNQIRNNFFAVKAKDLSSIWGSFFAKNQFDILTIKTKDVIINKFNIIGRRFTQKNFEINV